MYMLKENMNKLNYMRIHVGELVKVHFPLNCSPVVYRWKLET